jgi:hypothetical protein
MFSFMKSLALIGAAALTFVPLACQAGETQETPASGAAPQVPGLGGGPARPAPPRRRGAAGGGGRAPPPPNPADASSINSVSSTICVRDANADCGRETKVAAERNRTCVADARPSEHSNPNP